MHHFFISEKKDNNFILEPNILHQMKNVLKFKPDTEFIVVYKETKYCCILDKNEAKIIKTLKNQNKNNELSSQITVAIGSLKIKKIEFLIQKCTELGISKILIVQMERSITNYHSSIEKKMLRWNTIAKEASEQSRRYDIPKIIYLKKVSELEKYKQDINYVCYENEKENKLSETKKFKSSLILIGPEGGIKIKEIDILKKMDFKLVSLTKTILRSETAVLYAVITLLNN